MTYKYKVGDRVKVVKEFEENTESPIYDYCGCVGAVVKILHGEKWLYDVGFRGKGDMPFSARELEAAPAKKKGK